jgi:hypothetical protein
VTGDLSDKAYHDLRYRCLSWRSRKPRFRIAQPAGLGEPIVILGRHAS